ncbi:MAG: hypothetical protein M1587_04425 [Thaumarchaeota archaeon]|nr:hypothetical protein [Nitrososphaerota archaeon]
MIDSFQNSFRSVLRIERKFTKPVFFGDTLNARIKVADKQARDTNGMLVLYN